MKQKTTTFNRLIIYTLILAITFPILSGFVWIIPAYAADDLTESKGFMSLLKGLLSLFFFSFLSNESEIIDDSYESAAQEDSESLPENPKYRVNVSQEDKTTLAKAVYSEARGEPFEGQVAVASVIINRVLSGEFPNSVNGVVFQKTSGSYAFSAVLDGQIHLTPDKTAYKAIDYALKGWDPSEGALYYYNPITATSSWIFENVVTRVKIGNHVFGDLKR